MTTPNQSAIDFKEGFKAGFHEGLKEAHERSKNKTGEDKENKWARQA